MQSLLSPNSSKGNEMTVKRLRAADTPLHYARLLFYRTSFDMVRFV
jgi:hypothetical protein